MMMPLKKALLIGLALLVLFSFAVCEAEQASVWTCPACGMDGLNQNFCPNCGAKRPASVVCSCGYVMPEGSAFSFCPNCGKKLSAASEPAREDVYVDPDAPYDIGLPYLNGARIRQDQMSLTVLWVQTQLKATGTYYQGEKWDVTGSLGSQTMTEIASFMRARGYGGHNGQIDQTVVDELAAYLGSRVVPVYAGGFYDRMNSIMTGGSAGSMSAIVSNLRDMIPHVTTGARWVQCCLSKLGYYDSAIDGKYGEGTEYAVKAFQRSHGFQERDYVTLGVARAMLEECYNKGYSLSDLP